MADGEVNFIPTIPRGSQPKTEFERLNDAQCNIILRFIWISMPLFYTKVVHPGSGVWRRSPKGGEIEAIPHRDRRLLLDRKIEPVSGRFRRFDTLPVQCTALLSAVSCQPPPLCHNGGRRRRTQQASQAHACRYMHVVT